jgi:hypothetical protein
MLATQLCSSTWSIILVTASYADALNVCPAPYLTLRLSPPNLQALSEKKKPPASQKQRRHSDAEIQPWLKPHDSRSRMMFKRAATTTRVIIRLRILSSNRSNSGKVAPTPRPRCGSSFCAYELLSSPLVVRSFFPVVGLLVD